MHKGSCLCGAVRVEITGELHPPDACHCSMCRRQSGHYWASTDILRDQLTVHGADNVTWYQASTYARRGFCKTCGSFLFWEMLKGERTAVAMGCLDAPTGTHVVKHIFVADKGDYYELADGVPQLERY